MTNPFGPDTTQTAPAQPAYAPPAPQGYPTTPAAPPPAVSGQHGGADDPFGGPAPQANRPRVRDLEGRTLLIMPKSIKRGLISAILKDDKGNPVVQDRMTADVVVLAPAEPVAYGGTPENPQASQRRPHDKSAAVPWFIPGMWISNDGLVSQSSIALANVLRAQSGATPEPGAVTMVLGRLYQAEPTQRGRQGSWLIDKPTDEEKALARAWLRAKPRDPFGA